MDTTSKASVLLLSILLAGTSSCLSLLLNALRKEDGGGRPPRRDYDDRDRPRDRDGGRGSYGGRDDRFRGDDRGYDRGYDRRGGGGGYDRRRDDRPRGSGKFSPPRNSDFGIHVAGVPDDCGWADLKDTFRTVGEVCFADVRRDRDGNTYGLVEFKYEDDMQKALKDLDGTKLLGRVITLTLNNKRGDGGRDRKRSPSPRDRSRSPRRSSRSPRRSSRSPRPSKTQKKRTPSPRGRGRSPSPRGRSPSPRDRSGSPRRGNYQSPPRRSSNDRNSRSPDQEERR